MPAVTGIDFLVRTGNARRTVTLANGSVGETFTLTFDGVATAAIAYDADAATVEAALEALANLAAGDVAVTGSAGGPYTITFSGDYAGQVLPTLTGAGTGDLTVTITDPGPTYVTVAGKRGATLQLSQATADATSGDSAGWEENLPTNRSWGIEEDGVWIEGSAALAGLEAAWRAGRQVTAQVRAPSGTTYTGVATVTNIQFEGPHDDVSTVSISLQGSGTLTPA